MGIRRTLGDRCQVIYEVTKSIKAMAMALDDESTVSDIRALRSATKGLLKLIAETFRYVHRTGVPIGVPGERDQDAQILVDPEDVVAVPAEQVDDEQFAELAVPAPPPSPVGPGTAVMVRGIVVAMDEKTRSIEVQFPNYSLWVPTRDVIVTGGQ